MTVVFTSRFAPIAPSLAGPPIPTGLAAAPSTQTQINLTWNPVTSDPGGPGLKDYGLYRIGTGLINYVTSVSYSDTGLTPGTAYTYYVTARDLNLVESPQSLPATATTYIAPPAPTGLTAHVNSTTQIEIDWNITTDPGGPGIVRYGVYLNGVSQGQVASVSFLFNGLSPGTTYSFQVSSVDANNIESPLCAPVFATTQGSAGPSITIYNGFSFTVVPPGGALTSFGTRTATPLIWDHGQDAAGIMNASWGGGWPNAASNSVANLQNRTAPFQLLGSSTIQAPTPYTPRFLGGNHYDVNTSAGGNNVMAWAPMYPPPGASWYSYMEGYGMDDPNWWYCVGLTTYTFTATYVMGNSTFTYQGTIPAGITTGDGNQLFSLSNVAFTSTSASPCNIVSVDYVHNTITMNKTALVSATLGLQSVSYSDRDENVKKFDSTANSTVPYSALDWYATNTPGGPKTNTAGDSYTLGEFDGVPANPDNNGHSSSWNASNNPANPAKGYNGGWFKWSYAAKWSTGTDGFWKYWEVAPNGVSQIVVNYQGPTLYSGLTSWGESVGGYSRNQGAMGLNPFLTSPVQGAGVMGTYTQWRYFGNVYYDRNVSTLARFYLTNSPTYAVGSANLAEAQPPTAWAPTSATLTGNVGNLALGPAYLWFIDEANSISPTLVDTITVIAAPLGPANDTFPRVMSYNIAGGNAATYNAAGYIANAQWYNTVVMDTFIGAEGASTYPQAITSIQASPQAGLLTPTRCAIYIMASEQSTVGGGGNQSTFTKWSAALNSANQWVRNPYPAGAIVIQDANSGNILSSQNAALGTGLFSGLTMPKSFAQYFTDTLVNGLAVSKYGESQNLTANPKWNGFFFDNHFDRIRQNGDWGFTGATSGSGTTAGATTDAWIQQGGAQQVGAFRAANPGTLIIANTDYFVYKAAGTTIVLDPSQMGLYDYNFCEEVIGLSTSIEQTKSFAVCMNALIAAEAQVSPIGVLVLSQYNASGTLAWTNTQSTWTAAMWQGWRFGGAMTFQRNWAWQMSAGGGPSNTLLLGDELKQGTVGWLGQPIDPPQSTSRIQGVWYRIYQNGMVICNPKGNGIQTITLPSGTWKRLTNLGAAFGDPAVNTGATVTSVTLQDRDGLFLRNF